MLYLEYLLTRHHFDYIFIIWEGFIASVGTIITTFHNDVISIVLKLTRAAVRYTGPTNTCKA